MLRLIRHGLYESFVISFARTHEARALCMLTVDQYVDVFLLLSDRITELYTHDTSQFPCSVADPMEEESNALVIPSFVETSA